MSISMEAHVSHSEKAIALLKEGNIRFTKNQRLTRNLLAEVQATKEKQNPFAVVVSCMDSRTSPEIIFDRGLGDIFSIRIAGNVITPEVIGSVEYACAAVGSSAVVVLGHTGCGAIKGTVDEVKFGHLPSITDRIRKCIHPDHSIEEITLSNVVAGVKMLTEKSEILKELVKKNELKIVGGIYDITTGEVSFIDKN